MLADACYVITKQVDNIFDSNFLCLVNEAACFGNYSMIYTPLLLSGDPNEELFEVDSQIKNLGFEVLSSKMVKPSDTFPWYKAEFEISWEKS